MGNMHISRMTPAPQGVQAKLKVGAADDRYEREADAMANRVMRMPSSPAQPPDDVSGGAAGVQKGRNARRVRRLWPLRPGSPPGSRRRPVHEVDDVLKAAHGLAFDAIAPAGTRPRAPAAAAPSSVAV